MHKRRKRRNMERRRSIEGRRSIPFTTKFLPTKKIRGN